MGNHKSSVLKIIMGNHNSSVLNSTDEEVYIVLQAPGGDSSCYLQPGKEHVFPTRIGQLTWSVYEKGKDGKLYTTATVSRTEESDLSMKVEKHGGRIQIVRWPRV